MNKVILICGLACSVIVKRKTDALEPQRQTCGKLICKRDGHETLAHNDTKQPTII